MMFPGFSEGRTLTANLTSKTALNGTVDVTHPSRR